MESTGVLGLGYIRTRGIRPIITVVLMVLALFPLAWTLLNSDFNAFSLDSLAYILRGRYFADMFAPFDKVNAGFCLDQPTIGKFLFWFAAFSVLATPYAVVAGLVSKRTTRAERLAFALPTILLVVLLLSLLLPPLQLLVQYVHSMGFTPKRVYGLAFIAASCVTMLMLVRWAIRPGRPTAASGLALVIATIVAPLFSCLFYEPHLAPLALPLELLTMLFQSEGLTPASLIALAYLAGSCVMTGLLVFWTIRRPHNMDFEEVATNG